MRREIPKLTPEQSKNKIERIKSDNVAIGEAKGRQSDSIWMEEGDERLASWSSAERDDVLHEDALKEDAIRKELAKLPPSSPRSVEVVPVVRVVEKQEVVVAAKDIQRDAPDVQKKEKKDMPPEAAIPLLGQRSLQYFASILANKGNKLSSDQQRKWDEKYANTAEEYFRRNAQHLQRLMEDPYNDQKNISWVGLGSKRRREKDTAVTRSHCEEIIAGMRLLKEAIERFGTDDTLLAELNTELAKAERAFDDAYSLESVGADLSRYNI